MGITLRKHSIKELKVTCQLFMVLQMAKLCTSQLSLLVFIIMMQTQFTNQLEESQIQAVLSIQQILNYPLSLNSVDRNTDFCSIEPTPYLTIVCYEENITQLHTRGLVGVDPLSGNFSMNALFAALTALPELRVLSLVSLGLWGPLPHAIANLTSLEILNFSSNHLNGSIPVEMLALKNLQTVVLDHNGLSGSVPSWVGSLSELTALSLKNNSLSGSLPKSLSMLANLRILQLSMNQFTGEVPDLSSLTNLQVLDLGNNGFGPEFPALHNKLVTLVLRKNRFSFGMTDNLSSFYQLQKLDVSDNGYIGQFSPFLLSLPLMGYLNIAGNKFHGLLLENMTCGEELNFVDLSNNFLTGDLPACLKSDNKSRVVVCRGNCLSNKDRYQRQHPYRYCRNQALAVKPPCKRKGNGAGYKVVVAMSIVGGSSLAGLVVFGIGLVFSKQAFKKPQTRTILENATNMYPSKLFMDAREICQVAKLGPLGLPAYRNYHLDEIKEATSNFDKSNLLGEGSHGPKDQKEFNGHKAFFLLKKARGQEPISLDTPIRTSFMVYNGLFGNEHLAAVLSLALRKRRGVQAYTHHIELLSKLRHMHLVSALGHCFEYHPEDSSVSKVHLVFEFLPNGTLRDFILGQKPTWSQRITAAVAVAKGIQFLQTGIMPGLYSNNIKITDVLLDHDFHVKINNYNLPLLAENKEMVDAGFASSGSKEIGKAIMKQNEKTDVYDFGVILLEIISGKAINSENDISVASDLFEVAINADKIARKQIVDPAIHKECPDKSVKILMELCVRSISSEPNDRPSIEDVLWNLHFAAQVPESCQGDSASERSSPVFTSQ